MKKNVGSVLALYPTPLVIVGTIVDGKPNWPLVGHLGIIGHDRVMVSMAVPHYSNSIKFQSTLPVRGATRISPGSATQRSLYFNPRSP